MEVSGKFNTAIIYANSVENSVIGQLTALCNQEITKNSKIRIMPDAHAGAGCVIGTSMTITDRIIPNLVGVDIACGLEVINLGNCRMDFKKLDNFIHNHIPAGFSVRNSAHRFAEQIDLERLKSARHINLDKAVKSIGSLGGGNHFIEIDRDEASGDYYLLIHSGSRQTGLQVATYYQKLAGENRISGEIPFELAYLEDAAFADYVQDMKIMADYADLNRKAIADDIIKGMKWKAGDSFSTVHNYLDTENMILRKGAVSAQKGERLIIPLNMRDGSLICEGLGNPEWNYTAPHGAGRLMSRADAKNSLTLTQYKKDMEGIYSTCVTRKTIDESPMAYKPREDILAQIGETVKIGAELKPVYNFKAGAD